MTIWKSKHKIENISASNTAMKLKLGEHDIAEEMYQMVYILMLLWQYTQFQIVIMQEWLPLYLIFSKHRPFPIGLLGELVQYGHCICLKWDESFHPIQSNRQHLIYRRKRLEGRLLS